MTVFRTRSDRDFEQIVISQPNSDGFKAIIAIHDTTLGPALGGCRMWPYPVERQALDDVKRLARGMTYKAALAGLPLGGGKAVIIGDPRTAKSPDLWQNFAAMLNDLQGRYITAEDVGTSVEDMAAISRHSQYVAGRAEYGGDPSPMTALGVFHGIRTAVAHKFGESDLKGIGVAVQGLGHVGFGLCRLLHQAGARLYVTDVDKSRVVEAVGNFAATAVDPDNIYGAPADVFAPCALGGALSQETVPLLRAGVVAGAANNQLAEPNIGTDLMERGILYAPDYVINAGGLISIAQEALSPNQKYDRNAVTHRVTEIATTLDKIIKVSDETHVPTAVVADSLAETRINQTRQRNAC